MKKPLLVAGGILLAAIVLVVLAGVIRFNFTNGGDIVPGANGPEYPAEVKNLVVTIGDEKFALANGVAEKEAAPGSATKNTVRVVGEPVMGDGDGDGDLDAALLILNDPGGSGTFYYAVLAIRDAGSYHATNALALGDRIAPQTVAFAGGRFVYNFAERKPGESMAVRPSVEKSVWIRFDKASGVISEGS